MAFHSLYRVNQWEESGVSHELLSPFRFGAQFDPELLSAVLLGSLSQLRRTHPYAAATLAHDAGTLSEVDRQYLKALDRLCVWESSEDLLSFGTGDVSPAVPHMEDECILLFPNKPPPVLPEWSRLIIEMRCICITRVDEFIHVTHADPSIAELFAALPEWFHVKDAATRTKAWWTTQIEPSAHSALRLRLGGWFPGRRVETYDIESKLVAAGYVVSAIPLNILREFYPLSFFSKKTGRGINFRGDIVRPDREEFPDLEAIVGQPCCQIAQSSFGIIYATPAGEIVCWDCEYDEWSLSRCRNITECLEDLLTDDRDATKHFQPIRLTREQLPPLWRQPEK